MGRKPTRWTNLPKGMRARPRGKLIHYYLDTGQKPRKEIPLGSDYVAAVAKWAELTSAKKPAAAVGTFAAAVERYWLEVIPTKAPRTQQDNEDEKVWLLKFFNEPPAPLDAIKPLHIRQYLDWSAKRAREAAIARNAERVKQGKTPTKVGPTFGQVRANREKALFSHIFNFAREKGLTDAPNPCQGVKGFREVGRDVYVSDDLLNAVLDKAGKPLEFALRLAHLTGQRPGDVLRMQETDIDSGVLRISQGKTKAKLRIVIEGELMALLAAMAAYKVEVREEGTVRHLSLLVDERGRKLTAAVLRNRFDDARDAAGVPKAQFQFRDMRAKAATELDDVDGTKAAQALLGHTTETMTANYIRHKVGKKVRPLR